MNAALTRYVRLRDCGFWQQNKVFADQAGRAPAAIPCRFMQIHSPDRQLIREMAAENPTWGEERIAHKLQLKLTIRASRAPWAGTFARAGQRAHPDPKQRRLTFLRNHPDP
jgi:hypothetical protein